MTTSEANSILKSWTIGHCAFTISPLGDREGLVRPKPWYRGLLAGHLKLFGTADDFKALASLFGVKVNTFDLLPLEPRTAPEVRHRVVFSAGSEEVELGILIDKEDQSARQKYVDGRGDPV